MVSETMTGFLSLFAGAALGLIFYGGLWWTVLKGLSAEGRAGRHPAVWFLGSEVLRTGITLTGFYLVASGDLKRLLFCFGGFLIGRVAVTRFTRPAKKTGGGHAP